MRLIGRLARDERGGTAIEYGLICSLVIVAMLAALIGFGHSANNMYNNVTSNVSRVM